MGFSSSSTKIQEADVPSKLWGSENGAVHRLQHPGAAIALVIITDSCAYQNHRCAISKGEADFLCFIRPSTA